jgi:hypothetical protein
MNDAMQPEREPLSRYLDGELDYAALPEDVKPEAQRFERIVRALRDDPYGRPRDVRDAVMAEVRAATPSPWRRAWQWARTPQTLRLSPLTGALALAAGLAILVVARSGNVARSPELAGPAAGQRATTRFVFMAPQAGAVAITGDFVNWDPQGVPLTSRGDGVWTVEVPLEPGIHHYVFIVDGHQWQPDPNAAMQVDDGFGQRNSVIVVPAATRS